MQANAIQVGVIGAGNWGRNVVRTFHALGALGAVAEAATAAHPGLAAEFPGVPLHADHRAVLSGSLPAVVVATPAASHAIIAREALLAGKDVLVEKPMTLTAAEAEELVALARAQGRILTVGHLLLFQPAIQWLKGYLDRGGIGRLFSLHQERLNLGRARLVENALWSLGVHDVAVLLYLMGQTPDRVEATCQRVLQSGIADDVYLHLHFPGGVMGHLHTSWLWPERRRRLVAVGSAGTLAYDELEQTVTLHRKWITPELENRDEGSEVLFRGGGSPLRREAEHFLEAVRSRTRSPLIDGEHGAQVIRVLEVAGNASSDPGSDPAVPQP